MSNTFFELHGLDDLFDALDAEVARITLGCEDAVAQAVDNIFDESQARVPYDDVTTHASGYVHLRDSAEKEVDGLEGSVSYGTDHAWFVEQGTSRMQAQPYLQPAAEHAWPALVKQVEEVLS